MKKRMGVGIVVALMIVVAGTLGVSNLVDLLWGHENSVKEIVSLIDRKEAGSWFNSRTSRRHASLCSSR